MVSAAFEFVRNKHFSKTDAGGNTGGVIVVPGGHVESLVISSNSVKSGEFPWSSLYVMDSTGSTGSVAPQVSSITVKFVRLSSRSLTKNVTTSSLDRVASGSETTESTVAP